MSDQMQSQNTASQQNTPCAQTSNRETIRRVNVNTATWEEIAEVCPMLGKEKAQAIVAYRQQCGRINNARELQHIPGFAGKLSEGLEPFLSFTEDSAQPNLQENRENRENQDSQRFEHTSQEQPRQENVPQQQPTQTQTSNR